MSEIGLFFGFGQSVSFADGICHLITSFANSCVIETNEGLIIFDIGQERFGPMIFDELRQLTDKPVKYIIYSHGHFDHCFGFQPFLNEIEEKGFEMPQIIAHANIVSRFDKYRMLEGYHKWINSQQFSSVIGDEYNGPSVQNALYPTILVKDKGYSFDLDGYKFHLYHEWGETDDALWLWFPDQNVVFSGDLLISGYPNVGNPFKVQRYPKHWAHAMENMRDKNAYYIAPGHGNLIEGESEVTEVLTGTAEAMHFVHDEVVKRMNEGKWFEQIYHEMLEIYPEDWKKKSYLLPVYGCYEFSIHAVYRLYHGWYNSGNPTYLFPASSREIACGLLKIADVQSYIDHCNDLLQKQRPQLALHIIDVVIDGIGVGTAQMATALELKIKALEILSEKTSSFIVENIYRNEITRLKARIEKIEISTDIQLN